MYVFLLVYVLLLIRVFLRGLSFSGFQQVADLAQQYFLL
jgi:hypothetical protein